jgi:hypothetical protein
MKEAKTNLSFRKIESLMDKMEFWIYANVAVSLAVGPASVWLDRTPENVSDSLAITQGVVAVGALVLTLGTLITGGIMFMVWMYRAYVNSMLITKTDDVERKVKSAWVEVIGGFLIPFYNLFKPYQNMRLLWQASDVKAGPTTDWEQFPTPPTILIWWLAYLISTAADRATNKLHGDGLIVATGIDMLATLVSGILVVRIARAITTRQTHKIHMLQAQQDSA